MLRDPRKGSLARFGTSLAVWTAESALHESGAVEAGLETLRREGGGRTKPMERAGSVQVGELGDDKDRVLVRSNGQPTYFAGDVAYVRHKFDADSTRSSTCGARTITAPSPRFMAAVEALGFQRKSVEVEIIQMVSSCWSGEAVHASKRAGVIVRLDELVDEVGADAARYTFLTRSIDAPLEFDIALTKEQAPENPVFYVQYAHARISSILRKAADEGDTGRRCGLCPARAARARIRRRSDADTCDLRGRHPGGGL